MREHVGETKVNLKVFRTVFSFKILNNYPHLVSLQKPRQWAWNSLTREALQHCCWSCPSHAKERSQRLQSGNSGNCKKKQLVLLTSFSACSKWVILETGYFSSVACRWWGKLFSLLSPTMCRATKTLRVAQGLRRGKYVFSLQRWLCTQLSAYRMVLEHNVFH